MAQSISLTPQAINALFQQLSEQKNTVFWICTFNYTKQLYISPSFTEIWQRDRQMLYDDMSTFRQTIVEEDCPKTVAQCTERIAAVAKKNKSAIAQTLLFRIWRPDGETRFMKDRNFILHDGAGNPKIMAGVCYSLNPTEWQDCIDQGKDNGHQGLEIETDFLQIIERECQPFVNIPNLPSPLPKKPPRFTLSYNGKEYAISYREMQCLLGLIQGQSAKVTAHLLQISQRTVETYFDRLKTKFRCRTKFELASKLALSVYTTLNQT